MTHNESTSASPADPPVSVRELLGITVLVLGWVVAVVLAVGAVLTLATWVTGAGWLMWFWLPGSAVLVLLLFVLVEAGALPEPTLPRRSRRHEGAS